MRQISFEIGKALGEHARPGFFVCGVCGGYARWCAMGGGGKREKKRLRGRVCGGMMWEYERRCTQSNDGMLWRLFGGFIIWGGGAA